MTTLARFYRFGTALLFAFMGIASIAMGQTGTATISGLVTDDSGALIVKAELQLKSVDKGFVTNATSNNDGIYVFTGIQPGRYQIKIHKPGFKQVDFLDLILNTQDHVQQNFRLQVGSVSESVTVNASREHMETDDPAVGLLVDRTFVENMPLNGRSFQDLIALAPGAVSDSTNGNLGLFSVNGQRGDANYFTVDGVAANTNSAATNLGEVRGLAGALPAQTALGTTQSLVSLDALQEFKIQTSGYSAENGRQPGGQVQLTTRSGTNETHGSLFEYFRNEAFDANNWLFNANSIPRQPERQNDFGGTIGGVVKVPGLYDGNSKTFYFVSYEGLRLSVPAFGTAVVPTVALRQFASPAWQPFLNASPIPNGPENGDECASSLSPSDSFSCTAQWRGALSNASSLNSWSLRVDQIIGSRLQVFFRYSDTPSSASGFNATGSGSDKEIVSQNSRGGTVGGTWIARPSLVDELRFNWTENAGHQVTTPAAIGGAAPYAQGLAVPSIYVPSGTIAGAAQVFILGSSFILPPQYNNYGTSVHQYNLIDSITLTRGKHSFKFGGDFRRLQSLYNVFQYAVQFSAFSALSVEQGVADGVAVLAGRPGHPTFSNLSLYAQDNWKVNPRLTLDYGARWEFNPPPGASEGKYPIALTTGSVSTAQIAPQGTAQYQAKYHNFAPRIGFAYRLNSSQSHTVLVRAGFGIFYDTGQNLGASGYAGDPFSAQSSLSNVQLPADARELAPPTNFPNTPPYFVYANDPHLTLPYTEQWNLSTSVGLTGKNILTMSYVGNQGKRLLFTQQYPNPSGINPNFAFLQVTSNASASNYNALQLQDQGYITSRAQVVASYTYAHARDNDSTELPSFPPTPGNSANDIRHVFNIALNYQVPGAGVNRFIRAMTEDWSLDGRFTAQTGVPVDIIQSKYLILPEMIGAVVSPDLLPGIPVVLRNVPGTPFGWSLNPAAFTPVPLNPDGSPTRQGNVARNFVHGPGFWNLNMAVQRQFRVTDRLGFVFRVEAFNVINHPNGSSPDSCLCDGPSFGKITGGANTSFGVPNALYATGSARSLQFAFKMQF